MGKKFSRDTTSRRAMYRALVRSFVLNRGLVTTYSKTRVIVPILEKLIHKAKRNTLADRRFVYSFCGNDREVVDRIFELSKKITSSKGGILKYINLPARKGDNAPMARVELAEKIVEKKVEKEGKAKGKGKLNDNKITQSEQRMTESTKKKVSVPSVLRKIATRRKQ